MPQKSRSGRPIALVSVVDAMSGWDNASSGLASAFRRFSPNYVALLYARSE
jgi:hypothetical protein